MTISAVLAENLDENTLNTEEYKLAYKELLSIFKTKVKADALTLREEKQEVRNMQRENSTNASGAQSSLALHRSQARARHLLYGTLRGRKLEQMERNYSESTTNQHHYFKHTLRTEFNIALKELKSPGATDMHFDALDYLLKQMSWSF